MSKSKMGRPPIDFNYELLEQLCCVPKSFMTQDMIVRIMKAADHSVSLMTIRRAIRAKYKTTFGAFRAQKEEMIDAKLHAKQLDVALRGNPTMLIWLGKQRLGQGDKVQAAVSHLGEQYTPPVYNTQSKSNDKDE